MTRICICGGGSLGHVCAGVLSSKKDVIINILTQQPCRWSNHITVTDPQGQKYLGNIGTISNNPEIAISDCDIVLLCLPGFAIEKSLQLIKPYIKGKIVGSIVSSTGFFFTSHRILGEKAKLFGFQRVPFIARIDNYGHSANLLGYKSQLYVALENITDKEDFRQLIEYLWGTPTTLLSSYYEASLTNSNPILHTGRLYSMWKDWNGHEYSHNILFYKEWNIEASQVIIEMDTEFMKLLDILPIVKGSIPTLLKYYDSYDAESLTKKISSIPAFQKIVSPMKESKQGWIPDFNSRYFTEDFPYGLRFIVDLAKEHHVETPYIDKVYQWGINMIDYGR